MREATETEPAESVATETATETLVEDKALATAQRYRKVALRLIKAEIDKQQRNGYLRTADVRQLYGLIGLPVPGYNGDPATTTVTFEVTARRTLQVPSRLTAEQMVARIKEHDGYSLNALRYTNSDKATVNFDTIEGLPVSVPVTETPAVGETAETIVADVEAKQQAVRGWAESNRRRWCDDGVNDALEAAGLEKLPVAKYFKLTRRTNDDRGTATISLVAYSEAEAESLAANRWGDALIVWDDHPSLDPEVTVEVR